MSEFRKLYTVAENGTHVTSMICMSKYFICSYFLIVKFKIHFNVTCSYRCGFTYFVNHVFKLFRFHSVELQLFWLMNLEAFWCRSKSTIQRCVLRPSSGWLWWSQNAPVKRRSTSTRLHCAVFQKMSSSHSPPWEPGISHRLYWKLYELNIISNGFWRRKSRGKNGYFTVFS
jgi:hypothetical protein